MDFKEKLEEAKRLYESANADQKYVLESLFPELKEINEEEIKKAMINFFKSERKEGDVVLHYGVNIESMISWLEKQGDSPIKWNKNTKDCKPKVSHSVLMKTTHGIAEGEWQGEYWHQYRWAGIVRDTDVLSWIELSDLEKQGEQKPIEWDADDDDKFFFLKARLKDYEDCIIYDEELSEYQKNNVRETTKEFLEWLDTIKERIGG